MSYTKVILDTDVVSHLSRGGIIAEAYIKHIEGKLLAISFITVGELYFGAEKANWGEKKRKQLETILRNYVVIPYDHEIARCYGRLVAERQKNGIRIEQNDAWIAACVVRHKVPLITHNAKHFKTITDLELITERL